MESQYFFYGPRIIGINFDFRKIVKQIVVIPLFRLKKYLILLQIASYFSEPNYVKYLVPS